MAVKKQKSLKFYVPGPLASFTFASMVIFLTWTTYREAFHPLTRAMTDVGNPDFYFTQSTANGKSFTLAYGQSFGFFDDIRESDWKLAQKLHAKTFPNHFRDTPYKFSHSINDKGKRVALDKAPDWYAENFQEEFHCKWQHVVWNL